jgi:hypothetical protein
MQNHIDIGDSPIQRLGITQIALYARNTKRTKTRCIIRFSYQCPQRKWLRSQCFDHM